MNGNKTMFGVNFADGRIKGYPIIHPIDPCAGTQDIYKIKKRFGDKITLCGNIDIGGVLMNGTAQEVRQNTKEHIDKLTIGGGYIVSSSHSIHQLIPIENFYAMRDAVHMYTRD